MKLIATLAIALGSILSCAAISPDMADYQNRLQRFRSGAVMTEPEVATVYYGTALQPGFNSVTEHTALEQAYSTGDMQRALTLSRQILEKDPTDLSALFKAYAAATATKDPGAPALHTQLLQICDAIFHSGKGVTDSSPYVITHRADLDQFLQKYLQPVSINGRARVGSLDAVKVTLEGIPEEIILYFSTFPAK